MKMIGSVTIVGALMLLAGITQAQNDVPRDVRNLVGAQASSADGSLRRMGYEFRGTEQGPGRMWAHWWDGRQCLSVMIIDGAVDAIRDVPEFDCGIRGASAAAPNRRPHRQHWYDEYIEGSPRAAEAEFERRGYVNFDGEKSRYSSYTWWYQRERDHCFKMTVSNGRVTDISADRPACDRMR